MSDELRPMFAVTLVLDGDDYPPTVTPVARMALEEKLAEMVKDGVIRAFTVRRWDEPF